MSDELTTCNCADIAPTMPTCRDTHLATCPVSQYVEREFAKVRKMLKENDMEGLAAYASRNNSERAKHAVLRNQLAACQEQVKKLQMQVDDNAACCEAREQAEAKVTALEQELDFHKCSQSCTEDELRIQCRLAGEYAARVRVLETELQTARAAVVTMEKVCKAAKAVDLTWDVDVTKPLPPYMDCIDIEPLMELRTAVDDYQRERRRPQ